MFVGVNGVELEQDEQEEGQEAWVKLGQASQELPIDTGRGKCSFFM